MGQLFSADSQHWWRPRKNSRPSVMWELADLCSWLTCHWFGTEVQKGVALLALTLGPDKTELKERVDLECFYNWTHYWTSIHYWTSCECWETSVTVTIINCRYQLWVQLGWFMYVWWDGSRNKLCASPTLINIFNILTWHKVMLPRAMVSWVFHRNMTSVSGTSPNQPIRSIVSEHLFTVPGVRSSRILAMYVYPATDVPDVSMKLHKVSRRHWEVILRTSLRKEWTWGFSLTEHTVEPPVNVVKHLWLWPLQTDNSGSRQKQSISKVWTWNCLSDQNTLLSLQ